MPTGEDDQMPLDPSIPVKAKNAKVLTAENLLLTGGMPILLLPGIFMVFSCILIYHTRSCIPLRPILMCVRNPCAKNGLQGISALPIEPIESRHQAEMLLVFCSWLGKHNDASCPKIIRVPEGPSGLRTVLLH